MKIKKVATMSVRERTWNSDIFVPRLQTGPVVEEQRDDC